MVIRPFGERADQLVPRRGLEPPRLSPLVPETSASTNSATWAQASGRDIRSGVSPCQRLRRRPPGRYTGPSSLRPRESGDPALSSLLALDSRFRGNERRGLNTG